MKKMSSLKFTLIKTGLILSILFLGASLAHTAESSVRIVYNAGVAPLKFQDETGGAAGLFPDIWQLWAKKVGKEIQFVKADTFDDSLSFVQSGRADIHAGLFKTAERETYLTYSDPILELNYYIFTHPAVRPLTAVEDTAGLIVGIQKGGFTEKWVRESVPGDRIAVYESFTELFRAAQQGQVKVFIATELSLFYYLSDNRLANIFAYDKQRPLYTQTYYSAAPKAESERIKEVNKGLALISGSERQQLENRWIVRKGRKIPAEFAAILTEAELAYLAQTEILKVHNESDWAPYNFNENGTPKGFSVDYISLVSEKIGSDIRFVNYPSWNEFLAMLKTGELDVMLNIAKTSDRERYLKFTPPYMEIDQRFCTRKDFPEIASLEELSGKKIAVPKGFYISDILKNRSDIKILDTADMTETVRAVSSGKADAFINPQAVGEYLISRLGITNLKINGPPGIIMEKPLPLHMAVSADRPVLASILEKAMSRISKADIQAIEERWLGIGEISELMTALTLEERSWIRAHPRLSVGIDPDFAPFEFFSENGTYTGIAADYIAIISQRLGIELKAVAGLTWNQAYEKAKNGEIDILPCVGITEERRQFFNYTEPYLQFVRVIITRKDSSVKGLDDLSGIRLAVQKNSSHYGFVKDQTSLEPILYPTFEDAMLALSGGEADAVIGNLAVAVHVMRKLMLTNLKIAAHLTDQTFPLAMAVSKDLPELVAILNKALATITPEEHWNIRRRWIELPESKERKQELVLTPEEREWIEKHPVIRVSSEPDYAPFDFTENGAPAGFSVDYLRLLAKRAGLQLEFVQDTWGNLIKKGKNKEIDLLHTMFKTPERAKHFLFTAPYKTVTNVIYVRDGVEGVRSVSDLSGRKVVVSEGDVNTDILRGIIPNTDFITYKTYEDMLHGLSLGSGDAAVVDSAVVNYLIRRHTLTNIRPVSVADFHANVSGNAYRLAVRNDWPELRDILQKTMDTVTVEEMDSLYMKWFGRSEFMFRQKTPGIALTSEEEEFIKKHKPLVFSEVDWQPLSIVDDPEKFQGIIADYLNKITEISGLRFVYQKSDTWAEVLEKYADGKIDVVPALSKNDSAGREILLSEPFVTFPLVIVTRNDVSYIKDASELNGRRVSVGSGYTSYHFLSRHYPEIKLVEADNVEEALIRLSNGQVFAFVGHMAVAVDHLQRLGMKHLKIAGEVKFVFDHRIGVDPKYPEAVSVINKSLASMTEQAHRDIYRKWVTVEYKKGIDYSLLWKIGIIGGLFLCLILFWNRKLAELNRELSIEITERKQMEKEILDAKRAAEAANRAKSAFLANMSHEIRTPMNSVLGFLSLVLDEPGIPDHHRKYLNTAYRSSRSLLGLINDILDVSKLESGRLELENIPFNLYAMLRETVRTLSITAKDKGLSLELEADPDVPEKIMGDPGRLKQILINLVGNAVKFTEKGGITVTVKLYSAPGIRQPASGIRHPASGIILHFSVKDTGIGIPADRLQSIFDPFTQADSSTSRRFGGTGLGTTISRQLVEVMGGEIWAESEEGKGSGFHFTIRTVPLSRSQAREWEQKKAGSAHPALETGRCFKILVAEDIEENIMLAKIRLEARGHTVIEARNGREAVEAYQTKLPEIILMDVHMPQMDGLEAAKRIREMEAGKKDLRGFQNLEGLRAHIPIVALTASVMKHEQKICLEAGMDEVAGKPVDFEELFAIMERLVPEGSGRRAGDRSQGARDRKQVAGRREHFSGIDIEKGLRTWQHEDVYKKALTGFCRDYGNSADEILKLVQAGDKDAAYRAAHALKGVAGNLALTDVYRIAAMLNVAIRDKSGEELISMTESLGAALNQAADDIRQFVSSDCSQAGAWEKEKSDCSQAGAWEQEKAGAWEQEKAGAWEQETRNPVCSQAGAWEQEKAGACEKETLDSPEKLAVLFKDLLNSFEEYNPAAAEPFLEKLSRMLSPRQTDPVKQQVDRFDFDAARDAALKLAGDLGIHL
jgi:ABC-type amino acid transport substrate-binding protein/CheY-like chemotaxis protein/nitrogen-specific signal transduction histidine kinase